MKQIKENQGETNFAYKNFPFERHTLNMKPWKKLRLKKPANLVKIRLVTWFSSKAEDIERFGSMKTQQIYLDFKANQIRCFQY